MSLMGYESDSVLSAFEQANLKFAWHPVISETSGRDVLSLLEDFRDGTLSLDILIIEGTPLTGPEGSGRYQMMGGSDQSMIDWIMALAARAKYTVAVGSCAAYGGIPMAGEDELGATGLQYHKTTAGGLLGRDYRSQSGLPVINVPGCAPHPDWIVETLCRLSERTFGLEDMDPEGRPLAYFSNLAHHGCSRNEYYEFKASAHSPADQGCLMENLGCRGTQALGDCNIRPWNGTGSCLHGGFTCIACTMPGFENPDEAFLKTAKVAGIPVGLPSDMPKAWFVALAALSKSATPERVRENAESDKILHQPTRKKV